MPPNRGLFLGVAFFHPSAARTRQQTQIQGTEVHPWDPNQRETQVDDRCPWEWGRDIFRGVDEVGEGDKRRCGFVPEGEIFEQSKRF
jgi:hypothetical protein